MFLINAVLALALTTAAPSLAASEDIPTLKPEIEISPEMRRAAENAARTASVPADLAARVEAIHSKVNSQEWQESKQAFLRQIASAEGLEGITEDSSELSESSNRVLLFVSSSMPIRTLRNYARDLEQVRGVLVMRGMIGGLEKVQPTLEFLAQVLRRDPSCEGPSCPMRNVDVVIDPIQFRKNRIAAVPAAVFQRNFDFQTYCEKGHTDVEPSLPSVVYGDAALPGLLREIQKLSADSAITPLINQLEKRNG